MVRGALIIGHRNLTDQLFVIVAVAWLRALFSTQTAPHVPPWLSLRGSWTFSTSMNADVNNQSLLILPPASKASHTLLFVHPCRVSTPSTSMALSETSKQTKARPSVASSPSKAVHIPFRTVSNASNVLGFLRDRRSPQRTIGRSASPVAAVAALDKVSASATASKYSNRSPDSEPELLAGNDLCETAPCPQLSFLDEGTLSPRHIPLPRSLSSSRASSQDYSHVSSGSSSRWTISQWSEGSYMNPPPSNPYSSSLSGSQSPPISGEAAGRKFAADEDFPSPYSDVVVATLAGNFTSSPTYDGGELYDNHTPVERAAYPIFAEQLESWLFVWDYSWRLSTDEDVTSEESAQAEAINIEVRGLIVSYTLAASAIYTERIAHDRLEDLTQLPFYLEDSDGEDVWPEDFSVSDPQPSDRMTTSTGHGDYRRDATYFSIPSVSELSPLFPDEEDERRYHPRDINGTLLPWFGTRSLQSIHSSEQQAHTESDHSSSSEDVGSEGSEDQDAEVSDDDVEASDWYSDAVNSDADNSEDRLPAVYNQYARKFYNIHGVIGNGGCARVFLVTDDDGNQFALKVTHKMSAFRTATSRRMLRQELRIMGAASLQRCKRLMGLLSGWERLPDVLFLMVCPRFIQRVRELIALSPATDAWRLEKSH